MFRSHLVSMTRKALSPALGLAAVLAAAGPVAAASYVPQGLTLAEAQGVGRICQAVMGLEPAEEHFQGCLDSLADQVRALKRARALADARDGCLGRGRPPGSPALAECEAARPEGGAVAVATLVDADVGPSAKSYFYASPTEVRRRERMACAHLGLEPAAPGFNSCVAALQSAMFSADNPEN